MEKRKGLALMILGKGKPEKKEEAKDENYEALLAACGSFLDSIGVDVDKEKEEAACKALKNFVQICMGYEED